MKYSAAGHRYMKRIRDGADTNRQNLTFPILIILSVPKM